MPELRRRTRKLGDGSHCVETILTVVETCHKQSRNTFENLSAALHAHLLDNRNSGEWMKWARCLRIEADRVAAKEDVNCGDEVINPWIVARF